MPAPAAAPMYPARFFMRPVRYNLGVKAFTLGGSPVTYQLRQQGYLDRLVIHMSGTYTVATATLVFNQMQPYNIVPNFLVQTPDSPLPPINLGGANLHAWNLQNYDFAPNVRMIRFPAQGTLDANAYHASIVDSFATAVGAQTLHLWWVLPFHLSVDDIRGTVPLGNSTITNLVISAAATSDIVTTPANLTIPVFNVEVVQYSLTPPPAGAPIIGGGVDTGWAVAYDETYQAIPAVGLQKVTIVPNYTILGILHAVNLNNAMDSIDVTSLALRINQSWFTDPTGIGPAFFDMEQTYQNLVPFPQGFFLYDEDVLGMVDWIHTEQVTEIESDLTIANGATLGTNPRIWTSLRRLVDLNPAGHSAGAG